MSDVEIEIQGLKLQGFHGATPEERSKGQPFVFDVSLMAHDAGVRSDQLMDTVDYTKVVACVREVSDAKRFNLIEALAAAIADALRVRKPRVRLEAPVEWTAATIERIRR
jgi:dihydroneopterin aldolase